MGRALGGVSREGWLCISWEGGWSSPLHRPPGGPQGQDCMPRHHKEALMCPMIIIATHCYPVLSSALRTLQLEVLITALPLYRWEEMGRQAQRGGRTCRKSQGRRGQLDSEPDSSTLSGLFQPQHELISWSISPGASKSLAHGRCCHTQAGCCGGSWHRRPAGHMGCGSLRVGQGMGPRAAVRVGLWERKGGAGSGGQG